MKNGTVKKPYFEHGELDFTWLFGLLFPPITIVVLALFIPLLASAFFYWVELHSEYSEVDFVDAFLDYFFNTKF